MPLCEDHIEFSDSDSFNGNDNYDSDSFNGDDNSTNKVFTPEQEQLIKNCTIKAAKMLRCGEYI